MGSELISNLIIDKVRENKTVRAIDMVKHIGSDYGLNVSYYNAWVGVEKAKTLVYGDQNDSFDLLRSYVDAAVQLNPGSFPLLQVDENSRQFRRIFFSFKESIDSFNYCRPLLFLDGTHLKGKFKGHLLSATGKDGNQDRRAMCKEWNATLCPVIDKRLVALTGEARLLIVVGSFDMTYEVQCVPVVLVDIVDRTCTCMQWQINGLPCSHGVACILNDGRRPLSCYVEKYFHVSNYASAYASPIHPVPIMFNDQPVCGPETILPPQTKWMPG